MDIQELRDQFKRSVLPVLSAIDDAQVVNTIADLDLRADDLWTECRSAVCPDTRDLRDRLGVRVQRVYALMTVRPDLRALLHATYAYGQYMQYHGQAKSPFVLMSSAKLFAQELPAVQRMPSFK